jgi:hypothetical protein
MDARTRIDDHEDSLDALPPPRVQRALAFGNGIESHVITSSFDETF